MVLAIVPEERNLSKVGVWELRGGREGSGLEVGALEKGKGWSLQVEMELRMGGRKGRWTGQGDRKYMWEIWVDRFGRDGKVR